MKASVQNILWGRAAGRCEFENCNRLLSRSPATQETRNLAEKAHIYAFSTGGPRASDDWPLALLNEVENLLLVCQDCHDTIDKGEGPDRYTAALLMGMKQRHEQRVEIATGIAPKLSSHVLTYGTHIGRHVPLPTFGAAAEALFPRRRFPAQAKAIELGTTSSAPRDHDDAFWTEQRRDLEHQFDRHVRTAIEHREISHVSVFAIAPQPLLVQLGALLGDITAVDVYQLHREPAGWTWPEDARSSAFEVKSPTEGTGAPALVLSVSATITPDRITRVLGNDVAIWEVTVPKPHNDVVKSPGMLAAFRDMLRVLLDQIKARHGHSTPLHIFPALPVSLAVELGRIRMPKADSRWCLYDENQAHGGFAPALTL